MARRSPHWTREHACKVIAELEASDQTMAQFAREQGVSPERIGKWRRKLRLEAEGAGPRFVELVARRESPPVTVRVNCPSGHQIEVEGVELLAGLRLALQAVSESARC